MAHEPVLLKEIIENLDIKNDDVFLDMTLGNGGHALEIANHAKGVKIIGIDADPDAVDESLINFAEAGIKLQAFNLNYSQFEKALSAINLKSVNKVLFDLGFRTDQIQNPDYGMSFQQNGPLNMTFSKATTESTLTAYDVVNSWSEETLADIIYGFGEETRARKIAKAIVEAREKKEIKTTFELKSIIESVFPKFLLHKRIHPATKTFQAIRIAVNRELESLSETLPKVFSLLAPRGRIAVISFHSLEDRIVKQFFKEKARTNKAILINKKPIQATRDEINSNPKSRSAKLRIIEKI